MQNSSNLTDKIASKYNIIQAAVGKIYYRSWGARKNKWKEDQRFNVSIITISVKGNNVDLHRAETFCLTCWVTILCLLKTRGENLLMKLNYS